MSVFPPLFAERLRTRGAVLFPSSGVFAEVDERTPRAMLSGSFNPLHAGHRSLAAAAGRRLGCEVQYELSVVNADKPELTIETVAERVRQFVGVGPLWVTRAAAFERKADHFPGVTFVLGFDTAVRLVDPKYYGGATGRDAALAKLLDRGCKVVVGGRADACGVFRVWDEGFDRLRAEFADLFEVIPESEFRVDVSSSAIRGERTG